MLDEKDFWSVILCMKLGGELIVEAIYKHKRRYRQGQNSKEDY